MRAPNDMLSLGFGRSGLAMLGGSRRLCRLELQGQQRRSGRLSRTMVGRRPSAASVPLLDLVGLRLALRLWDRASRRVTGDSGRRGVV